ncbi:cytochrome C oxidase subunit IV family protein [Luteolibacter pohnpeiensis]|uniref:Cytochrome C oxidase subunit IV family protein n=1 Tax=Luteolibacter pohnpeiensis TaxID=454153 RepID=A0A934S8Z7_9BACT|nr:cytochrome C oxidase subunit IV family protein [Luteolibacter pohnpeiensis]MBK1884357.1 cytochrome C oxidase subunit IV family protein [Luteolibacter pohnpeiensis]
MANSVEEIQKAKKTYLMVFAALFACTILTYLVAEWEPLDMGGHGFDGVDATIGLLIALFKASLVALIFMHLNHEKKAVYWIFGGAFVGAAALYLLTHLAVFDPIHDTYFYDGSKPRVIQTEEAAQPAASDKAATATP